MVLVGSLIALHCRQGLRKIYWIFAPIGRFMKRAVRGGMLDWTSGGCFRPVVDEKHSCPVFTVSAVYTVSAGFTVSPVW